MEERILIQTENNAYVRDIHSKALLPNSRKEADEYQTKAAMFKAAKERDEEVKILKERMTNIETTLDDIKTLLIKAIKT